MDKKTGLGVMLGSAEGLIMRLFSAFFLTSALDFAIGKARGVHPVSAWREFSAGLSISRKIICILLAFILISAINAILRIVLKVQKVQDPAVLIFSSVLFALCAVYRSGSFYFGLGAGTVAAVFSAYGYARLPEFSKKSDRAALCGVLLTALPVFIFVALTTVMKHLSFGTPCFDMGIFLQMFNSLKENLTAVTSCERDRLMSHFQVHSSFIFYLILPIYLLIPTAGTILVVQVLGAMSGVLPLFWIAKGRGLKGLPLYLACFLYIFSAGLILPCYYSFHENALLPVLIMWLIYALEKNNIPLLYIMSALVCIVKEDAPLYVICLGLYYFFECRDKRRIHGALAAVLSSLYFIIVMNYLTVHGDGSYMTSSRLGVLIGSDGGGFINILKNVLVDPAYFFSLFAREETLLFICQTLLPLLLLPFFTVKLRRFILIIPYVIMCLVIGSSYRYAADIGFQYIFGPACLLIYMTILNAADLDEKICGRLLFGAAVITLVTTLSQVTPKIDYIRDYRQNRDRYASAERCIDLLPDDGSVLSNTFLLPHACDRREIYDLGNDKITEENGETRIKNPEKYDYLLLSKMDPLTEKLLPGLSADGWTEFASTEDFILILEKPR